MYVPLGMIAPSALPQSPTAAYPLARLTPKSLNSGCITSAFATSSRTNRFFLNVYLIILPALEWTRCRYRPARPLSAPHSVVSLPLSLPVWLMLDSEVQEDHSEQVLSPVPSFRAWR